jgi:hypothetical protein
MVFRGIPQIMQAGDRAYLSLRRGGIEQLKVECDWDGVAFVGEGDVTYGEYEGYFVLCRADGSQEQQNVTEALYGLPDMLEPVCEPDVCGLGWDLKNGTISLNALVIWLEPPWIMAQEPGIEWSKLDLVVKHKGREVARVDLREVCENATEPAYETEGFFVDSESVPAVPVYDSENAEEVCMLLERFEPLEFSVPDLKEGDRVELVLEGGLSNGYTFLKVLESFAF